MGKSKFAKCIFLPYSQLRNAPKNGIIIDVTSYADAPYNQLSPFYVHNNIPVPGMPGKISDTVEGIWQGRNWIISAGYNFRLRDVGGAIGLILKSNDRMFMYLLKKSRKKFVLSVRKQSILS